DIFLLVLLKPMREATASAVSWEEHDAERFAEEQSREEEAEAGEEQEERTRNAPFGHKGAGPHHRFADGFDGQEGALAAPGRRNADEAVAPHQRAIGFDRAGTPIFTQPGARHRRSTRGLCRRAPTGLQSAWFVRRPIVAAAILCLLT